MAMHPAPSPVGKLAIIVLAQLLGTSLWFSANAAFDDPARLWGIGTEGIGRLTMAVQLGLILGTLVFALSGLADRFAASRVFAACALVGAAANVGFAFLAEGVASGAGFRFVVGLALAGIYPLGMKLVVGWEPRRASEALAWLVGMLTVGTALPHGIRASALAYFGHMWDLYAFWTVVPFLVAGVLAPLLRRR